MAASPNLEWQCEIRLNVFGADLWSSTPGQKQHLGVTEDVCCDSFQPRLSSDMKPCFHHRFYSLRFYVRMFRPNVPTNLELETTNTAFHYWASEDEKSNPRYRLKDLLLAIVTTLLPAVSSQYLLSSCPGFQTGRRKNKGIRWIMCTCTELNRILVKN